MQIIHQVDLQRFLYMEVLQIIPLIIGQYRLRDQSIIFMMFTQMERIYIPLQTLIIVPTRIRLLLYT